MKGQGLMLSDSCDGQVDIGEESSSRKLFVGILVALGSFSASSPHFFLNLLTVFSCSISLVRIHFFCHSLYFRTLSDSKRISIILCRD